MWGLRIFLFVHVAVLAVHGIIKVINGLNPGPCTKQNRGAIVLIRDRKGNNQLLTCNKKNGVHGWSPINNDEGPTGRIFNPGYDCTSILDHNPEAKDGFFWITLNKKQPQKVWCDMKTDGGGYMLIGRKNSSITWSVPSNEKPVEPFGRPHWCSSFGGVDIVDFRVQMASQEDFRMTKAHWAYRLRTPRKLNKLMINNKGCTRNNPGIGDIAYVKNLATGDIATTNFRCSKFGIGHHPRTNIGWTMMNSCLQKPCPWGFAYHSKYPVQLDYSGSFSYSVSNNISGIQHGATAFVGCNKGYCCGCYGPLHGKLDYCFQKCKVRNGGTIEANVFTWFWVRASVSKKIWRKCIDYKLEKNGVLVWYKLVGSSEVPIEGRCDRQNKAILYDGMLVASDNTTARKALLVPGMIVYRQDNKKLYIAKDEKLSALAEERKTMEKIDTLNQKVISLEEEGKALNKSLNNLADLMGKALKKELTALESKYFKVGQYNNPGRSCLDIRKRRKGESLSNGASWIFLGNKAMKVYCDMTADGGGWTLVSNLVLKQSSGMKYSLADDYRQINEYDGNKLALSTHALRALGMKMPFQQLRFFCHKKKPGRTIDIATKNNRKGNLVVQYFKAQTNTMPNSCGSYYRLLDDNSILARQCARWGYQSKYFVGKWHHGGLPSGDRLFNHLAFVGWKVHWLVERSSSGRWECDDYISVKGYATSPGDFWKIFVR